MIFNFKAKKKCIPLLFLWSTYINAQTVSVSSDSNPRTQPSLVTCNIEGQLGNQLFKIATTLAYAWDYEVEPIFPELNIEGFRRPYNRDHIFFRLNVSENPRIWVHRFKEESECSTKKVPFQHDQYLEGYFQSWKHFHHHRERLLEIFAPSSFYLQQIKDKYGELINHPNTVSIHVRTGSKHKHELEGFRFIGMDYYRNAVRLFSDDALFVVFSDRIQWCKRHFEFCKNVVFIEGNDHILDLFLMSMMKHNIIGNSTFSWWGAYLNTNPEKIVVAPYPWSHPRVLTYPPNPPDGFFLPDWSILPVDLNGPYPQDMSCYDAQTQSIDDI